jgi:hypothetical protein
MSQIAIRFALNRRHANGVNASITPAPETNGFVATASFPGDLTVGEWVDSVEAGKALADYKSTCPQPCGCAPWPEVS